MEWRVRIARRNGLPYASAPVLIITLRECPIRHSVGCGQSIQGLATQGCLLVFSEPEPQFRCLTVILEFSRKNCTPTVSILQSYRYFGDFLKKTVHRPFRFFDRTVIFEISRKKLYADCFGFSIVQLFWSFLEKNCTPLVSVFRSYSYFGVFSKKNCTPTVLGSVFMPSDRNVLAAEE